ncbi:MULTISPECIES: SHOCT domain-containing protein [Bacillaceae]|uniref:SHOCT domain-containing protein n=1 Tax=Bacillaceae TaxID=186817 RepID=UPI001C589979|nr:SHOCT domain-containing protein [Rossellomorea sp. YZS02]MBW3110954.1 SHOCT domain-containing protein [Bacillus sp. MCCB 382]MDX8344298.1 SHOCT domain-containing protein [Rossellomorea sp. YZS02]
MMNGGGMGAGFFGTGFLFIILIVAIVGIFIWMMRGKNPGQSSHSTHHHNHHSLGLLKERLAKGEITEEEYERLKRKIDE